MECYKNPGKVKHILCWPFTWFMLIPFVILDFTIEIYHNICFRLCGIPLVKRSNYIKIDRYKLSYLTWSDKLNCLYCGYANGLLNYASEIAGCSEKYWCGIQHAKYKDFVSPKHHKDFLGYGDENAFKKFTQER